MIIVKLKQLWFCLDRFHQSNVVFILLLSLMGAFLEMLGLSLIYPILNFVISNELPIAFSDILLDYDLDVGKDRLTTYLVIFFAMFFLFKNFILTYFSYLINRLLSEVRIYISCQLFRGYIKSDYAFFITNSSSEITKNLTSLVNSFNVAILNPIGILLTEGFVLIALILMSLVIKPIDSLILFILIILPSMLLFRFIKHRIRRYGLISMENESLRIKTVNEMVGGIREILLLDKFKFFIDRFNNFDSNVATANFKHSFIMQSSKYFLECVLILAIAVLVLMQFLAGISFMNLIPLLGFYALAGFRIIPSINRLIGALQSLKFGEAIIDTINKEFKRNEKNISGTHSNSLLFSFENDITIKGVAFRYQPNLPYIFKDLNLKIKKGEAVGICGETGSGKSSLLNLILGFLYPTSGSIKIDGHDIHQNKAALKHILGYVPQDVFLLDDSIANNVGFGEEADQLNRKRVRWALKEAQMESFIKKQKEGIDTRVGERGVRLSGGQKQRLGIARALYFGAKILVFDEATSSLDEATEKLVMINIAKLKNKFTIIVVAHRLSTLKICDQVYTLCETGLVATQLD